MKKIGLSFIVFQLLTNLNVMSQIGENDTLLYAIDYEAPEKLNMLSFNIPIWHLGLSKINFSIYDLKGSVHYVGSGRVNGGISYKYSLGDKILPDTDEGNEYARHDYMMSIYKPGHAQEFSAYATVFVKDLMKSKPENYLIKKVGKTHYYSVIDTKYQTRHGISLGYAQGYTWYNMNKMTLDVYSEEFDVAKTVNFNSMSTVQHFKFITIGYQHLKSVNSRMNFEKYGLRTSRSLTVTGANLIVAVQNQFDDVYVGSYDPNASSNGTIYFERYKLAESNKRLGVGVEFYQRYFTKRFPISIEYKISYLPGMLKNVNFALNVGASLQIDALRGNIKQYDKKKDKQEEVFDKIRAKTK